MRQSGTKNGHHGGGRATGDMGDAESSDASSSRSWIERVAQVFSGEPSSRRELMDVIQDAARRQIVDNEALSIIDGAMQVSEMQAREIMIPRSQVVFVRADSKPREFLPVVIESQHSRFPVIGDDFDDVKGVLHAKDLLPLALTGDLDDFDLKDHIRRAPVIPESNRDPGGAPRRTACSAPDPDVGVTGPNANVACVVPASFRRPSRLDPTRIDRASSGCSAVAGRAVAATRSTVSAASAAAGGGAVGSVAPTPTSAILASDSPSQTYHASTGTPIMGRGGPVTALEPPVRGRVRHRRTP